MFLMHIKGNRVYFLHVLISAGLNKFDVTMIDRGMDVDSEVCSYCQELFVPFKYLRCRLR